MARNWGIEEIHRSGIYDHVCWGWDSRGKFKLWKFNGKLIYQSPE
jgi:hypothetical protein